MKRLGQLLSYPNVVSTLALVIATSGGAYAVSQLPAGSVGTSQLQNGAVTAPKLHGDAVTGAKVKNGSLAAADFAAGQLPNSASGGVASSGVALTPCGTTIVTTRQVTPKKPSRLVALGIGSWSTGGLDPGTFLQVLTSIRVMQGDAQVGMTGSSEQWGANADGAGQIPFSVGGEALASVPSTPLVLQKGVTYTVRLRFDLGGTCSPAHTPVVGNAELTTILTDNVG